MASERNNQDAEMRDAPAAAVDERSSISSVVLVDDSELRPGDEENDEEGGTILQREGDEEQPPPKKKKEKRQTEKTVNDKQVQHLFVHELILGIGNTRHALFEYYCFTHQHSLLPHDCHREAFFLVISKTKLL